MSAQPARQTSSILISLAFCMALQMTGFVILLPLFTRRFESFGAGVEALGVSAMAFALTSTFAAPVMGMLADRFGRRPIILISLAAYVVAFCGYLLATSAWLLIALRGISGIFTAGLLPAMTSMVGDLAPGNRRAQWIGIVNGGASTGWILGPFFGGLLYDRFGYIVPFAASILMELGALLLAVFWIPETYKPAAHPAYTRPAWSIGWKQLPARSTYLMLLLITFGAMLAWAFVEPEFMFYGYDDLGWTSSQLGMIMSAYGLAFMFGEFALGKISDRRGRKPVLVMGLVLFSAQFIGLVIFRDVAWIVVSFLVAGLGNALYDPALNAMILDIAFPEKSASMIGLKNTAGSLGSLLGPALVVLITPFVVPQLVFLISAVLVIMLALACGLVLRTQDFEVAHHYSAAAVKR
jgi:MFS family permease